MMSAFGNPPTLGGGGCQSHPLRLVTLSDGSKVYHKYGLQWPSVDPRKVTDPAAANLAIELEAFKIGGTDKLDGEENPEGVSKYHHFRTIIDTCLSNFEWNRWAEWCAKRICEYNICGFTGSASSAKSAIMAIYGLISYISSPVDTIVFVLTTTVKDAEQRIWKEFTKRFNELKRGGLTGFKISAREHHICMSDTSRGAGKGTSIQLVAAGDKDRDNALQKLQGGKADYDVREKMAGKVIVLWDEAQDCNDDVFRAVVNLANNVNFEFKCTGNASNRLDPHGQFCTPKNGWSSITAESKEWEICVNGKDGICVHLDGYDSPNFDDRDDVDWDEDGHPVFTRYNPSKKDRYEYIKLTSAVKDELEFLGPKNPNYWRQCRGFWPPSDVDTENIYPQADLIRYGAMDREVAWFLPPVDGAGIDPNRGGSDRFVFTHFKYGMCKIRGEDRPYPVLYEQEVYELKIIGDTEDSSQQRNMVLKCKELAESLGIEPRHVAVDCSSLDPIAGHFKDNWSRDILIVDFQGIPSDKPFNNTEVHKDGPRKGQLKTCREMFDRRVSELWMIGTEFLRNRQLAGISPDTAREMSLRRYETKAGKKIVEPKNKMRERIKGVSPDRADALFLCLELARERLGAIAGGGARKFNPYAEVLGKNIVDNKPSPQIKTLRTQRQFTKPPEGSGKGPLYSWLHKTGRR
jgi:hypothetical protein